MKKIAVIPASGIGSRMNNKIPKQYIKLVNGLTILDTTISKLLAEKFFDFIIVIISLNDHKFWKESIFFMKPIIKICIGGKERFNSIFNALKMLKHLYCKKKDWIFIHDAVRPGIQFSKIKDLFLKIIVQKKLGGFLGHKNTDSIKYFNKKKHIIKNLNRENIYIAHTPQIFQYGILLQSYIYCMNNKLIVTDDSTAIEMFCKNYLPIIIEPNLYNFKITYVKDIVMFNNFLSKLKN